MLIEGWFFKLTFISEGSSIIIKVMKIWKIRTIQSRVWKVKS